MLSLQNNIIILIISISFAITYSTDGGGGGVLCTQSQQNLNKTTMTAANNNNDVKQSFETNEIVSDVIEISPNGIVEISYPSGVSVNLGNELTPTQVKDQPISIKWDSDPNSYYTLIMTDPDAPSRTEPTLREVRHWTVVNIPGQDIGKGDTIFEYIGSGPPAGSGLHRYIFLIYKQLMGKIVYDEPFTTNRSRLNRISSSTRKFTEKYNLGNPIAGNFYQAQYDDYVPILHAKLGGPPPTPTV